MRIDFEFVRRLAREIGDIEEHPGGPALKAHGKLLAWEPRNRFVETGTLAVRIDQERRAELIAEAPEVYYLTDHYVKYPGVLVRMSRIHPDALRDLLLLAKSLVKPRSRGRGAKRTASRGDR